MVWGLKVGFARRGSFEIMASILVLCSDVPTQKTRIMYRCNLNSWQLQKFLEYLIHAELLEVVRECGKDYYRATEKGRELLRRFQRLERLIRPEGGRP